MRFVETPTFTRVIDRLLDDEEYCSLQSALMLRPEQGPLIRGWRRTSKGALGETRWGQERRASRDLLLGRTETAFYMLYASAKNEQGDLTAAQTSALGQLVREEFK
jgi:hypothetical protein